MIARTANGRRCLTGYLCQMITPDGFLQSPRLPLVHIPLHDVELGGDFADTKIRKIERRSGTAYRQRANRRATSAIVVSVSFFTLPSREPYSSLVGEFKAFCCAFLEPENMCTSLTECDI